jgi:hypothetical protein
VSFQKGLDMYGIGLEDKQSKSPIFDRHGDSFKDLDIKNQALFLQQELESAQQENKLLRDTIAIKNSQRLDSRANSMAGGAKDTFELENALADGKQTIENLKSRLAAEEQKTVINNNRRKKPTKS